MTDMQAAVLKAYPDYKGGFSLGSSGEEIVGTFLWNGVHWTFKSDPGARFYLVIAISFVLLAALFFDRFDPSRRKP